MSDTEHIYLAVPCYSDTIWSKTHLSVICAQTSLPEDRSLIHVSPDSSLLCQNFNTLWADALNTRADVSCLRWFVMLHSDLASPDPNWMMNLINAAEANHLEAIAAIARIKDDTQDTSTGLLKDGRICRLTMAAMEKWPRVISNDWVKENTGTTLLINTGMLALRLDKPWSERLSFGTDDGIDKRDDGKFHARVLSEDWRMSLWMNERGIPYGVTQDIPTLHWGHKIYPNGSFEYEQRKLMAED